MSFVLCWCSLILILVSPFQRISAYDQTFALCADQMGFIRCEKGTKIKIISAVYGRTDDKVCPYGNTNSRSCRSLTSEIKVKWSCNGYNTCHLHASKQIFGNPCSNISKYLQVKYRCMKGPDGGKEIVAFNAYIKNHLTLNRNTPTNVVYDTVYYNYGNAYNPYSGYFTAPSNGLYVFTWSSLVDPKKIFDAEILVNGQRKGLGNCNNLENPGYENCANTVPLVLKTGDKVNIRTITADYLHWQWSSFKGWKVQ
ncbi:uncharacterized protein LOC111122203 [Crassostrea virginica]